MKILITSIMALGRTLLLIAFFVSAIAFGSNSTLAATVKSNTSDTAKQAAKEVIKDTGVKEQFGQSENGNELLDKAQNRANQKLNKIADDDTSDNDLSSSKKLFLDNLTNKS